MAAPCHAAVVDLDRDGRLDLLIADLGDVPPSDHLKASVVWLQRLPDGGYRKHVLAAGLPRVADVEALDVDGDGDLDIVAVAYIPPPRRADGGPRPSLPSLVWLEQVARGRFERHTLETGGRHVSVDAADYDHDGDVDLVVGNFGSETDTWIEVWENLTVKK